MSHDPTDLRSQEERRRQENEEARVARLQEMSDFRWLMRQPAFRRFAWRLMGLCGVFRLTFHTEHSVASFLEGRRDIGLWLQGEIHEICPGEYEALLKERREKREMHA